MIDYKQRRRVALLTIDRPEARNAINVAMAHEIERLVDMVESDQRVWATVITGAGSAFCAGADLKAFAEKDGGPPSTERGGFAGLASRERVKPLIAAVNGPALAGGCEIVLACDMVVAAPEARFGLPEVKRSLVATAGGLYHLPRVLPRNIAMELALTGDPIDAERAYALGLVNELAPRASLIDAAVALAERVCENAPLAVRETRRVLLESMNVDAVTSRELALASLARVKGTDDFLEGPRAFLEKRPAEWSAS